MATEPDVIVGVPICRRTSFVLDKFLADQREIQTAYPRCRLVLATNEPDFVEELREQLRLHFLRGEVITYETVKPEHARTRVWNITCGREALRRHVLAKKARFFLSLDADMVFDASVVAIMRNRIAGFDAVFSGYKVPPCGAWAYANGCLLIRSEVLNNFAFTCYEFSGGEVIDESETVDWGLFRCHAKPNKGFFVSIRHYWKRESCYTVEPHPTGWFRILTNNPLFRFMLIQVSILVRHNIARTLQSWIRRIPRAREEVDRLG